MYVLVVIIFISGFVSSSNKLNLPKYIKKYEIVDCFVSNLKTKRDLFTKNKRITKLYDTEVRFKSYETYFHLILNEDMTFTKLTVESYLSNNSIQAENVTIKMFEGIVKNRSVRSYVVGYLKDNVFTGSVYLNETQFFIEPARKFFPNYTYVNKIIVYREEDTVYESINYTQKLDPKITSSPYNRMSKGINKTVNETEDYACLVEFVSDHTLYDYFARDTNELTAHLYLHAKYADFIFRRTDFDGDGKRDRIRIIVDKIFIYKNKDDSNYPMKVASDIYTLLEQFSYRVQEYCASVCMTARVFSQSFLGLAFQASAVNNWAGGICQKPVPRSYYSESMRSVNTAVHTMKNKKGDALPLSVSLLVVAHELGHSFGSGHDSYGNLTCSPGGRKGYYLMYPISQPNSKPLNSFFSPCSRKQIASVIKAKGECLKHHPATCGNAIQEGDEECDCGKGAFCPYVDECCTPSDAGPPEKGCTFNKEKKASCSPIGNKCCLDNCMINTDENVQCHDGFLECKVSFCEGKSGICPEPKEAPDKYPCRGTSKTCSGGTCNSSVCLDNGLIDCICDDIESECYICCKKKDKCVTASSLGFETPDGQIHYAFEGSLCNFIRYQCDGSGNCVNPRTRNLATMTKKSIAFWVAVCGLILTIIIFIFFAIYFLKLYPYLTN